MSEYRYDIDDFLFPGAENTCGLTNGLSQKSTTSQAGSYPEDLKSTEVGQTLYVETPRRFESGATRDTDAGKLDFEGFLSPLVLERYAQYMHGHRVMQDGSIRGSGNWQRGIPVEVYMKSAWRHFFDMWKLHRGLPVKDAFEDVLCAIMFNVMGYLHETIKGKSNDVGQK